MFLFFFSAWGCKSNKNRYVKYKKVIHCLFSFQIGISERITMDFNTADTFNITDIRRVLLWFGLVGVGLFSQHHHGVNSIQCSLLSVADAVSFNRALHLAFYYQFFTVANVPWHFWKCNFAPLHQLQWPYLHWVSWSFYHK